MDSSPVLDGLKNSCKGKLAYHTEWSPLNLMADVTTPKIKRVHRDRVFDLTSVKAALEAIEDDALVFENNSVNEMPKFASDGKRGHDLVFERERKIHVFGLDFEKCSSGYEKEILEENLRSNRMRIRKQEEIYADFSEKAKEQLAKCQKRQRQRAEKARADIENYLQQCEESAMKIQRDSQEHQAQLLKTRMQEKEERRLKLQHLEKQREEQGRERFTLALKYMEEAQSIHRKTLGDIGSFEYQDALSSSKIPHLLNDGKRFHSEVNNAVMACMTKKLMEAEDLDSVKTNLEKLKALYSEFASEMTSIRTQIEVDRRKAEEAVREAELQERLAVEEAEAARLKAAQASNPEFHAPSLPMEFKFCVSASAYNNYLKLKEKRNEYEDRGRELTKSDDKQLKRLALDLSRAVSVPISSITDRSGSDLKSKLRILNGLLKGDSVKVGTKSVSISSHPQALKFSTNLIAKKIVQQADEQISSNFSTAFCTAFAVLGVWAESPDFGELFLAHLQSRCPYTIPFYVPKGEKETDEDHQKMLGYVISEDGTVEGQDKYLKRMSGLVRLYAAVIQSPIPPGTTSHPHGLAHGWMWLSRMLNLDPYPDISATVMFDFLDVAGHALMKSYGRQFEKLLYTICHDYYPKIEEVSSLGQRAPLIRLKNFLEKCIKQKSVPVPEGRLEKGFWNTYHSGDVVGD